MGVCGSGLSPCTQVDATKMEGFVDNFLSSLGLGANTYTLLVINPT